MAVGTASCCSDKGTDKDPVRLGTDCGTAPPAFRGACSADEQAGFGGMWAVEPESAT